MRGIGRCLKRGSREMRGFARKKVILILVIVFALLCAGCGKKTPEKPVSATPAGMTPGAETPAPTAAPTGMTPGEGTPKPTLTPVPLHTPTPVVDRTEALMPLAALNKTEDRLIHSVVSAGEYVFVDAVNFDSPADINAKKFSTSMYLFKADEPDNIKSRSFTGGVLGPALLQEDGSVWYVDEKNFNVIFFDAELKETARFAFTGTYVGCSEDGLFWFRNDIEGTLTAQDAKGDVAAEYRCEGGKFTFCSMDGSSYVFYVTESGVSYLLYLEKDEAGNLITEKKVYSQSTEYEVVGRRGEAFLYDLRYSATVKLGSALRPQENRLIFMPGYDSSVVRDCRGDLVALSMVNYDLGRENFEKAAFAVVNTAEGTGVRFDNVLEIIPGCNYIKSAVFVGDSRLLLCVYQGEEFGYRFYYWDYSGEPSRREEVLHRGAAGSGTDVCEETAEWIRKRFGTKVNYKGDSMKILTFGYVLHPIAEEERLLWMMDSLCSVMMEYPEGFFAELPVGFRSGMDFYLYGEGTKWLPGMTEDAVGIATDGPTLHVALKYDPDYPNLYTTVSHEIMHLMDYRLKAYGKETGYDLLGYWEEALNSSEYPYFNSYTLKNYLGAYDDDRQRETDKYWFARIYGRTYPEEDRATVMEVLMSYSHYANRVLKSPHIREKAECLCAMIRAAFPSVAACREPMPWERLIGIVTEHPWEQ